MQWELKRLMASTGILAGAARWSFHKHGGGPNSNLWRGRARGTTTPKPASVFEVSIPYEPSVEDESE